MRGLPNVTYCTLTCRSLGNWGRHVKQHAFLYQLWITRVLLNILLGPPNHNSQNSPDETHDLGSWAKNKMLYHELELWALMRLYRHEFWTMGFGISLWIWTFLGFKRDFPKIHDSVNMVRVANDMKSCGVKNLSSTMWYLNERANGPCFLLCEQKRNYYRAVPWYCTCSKYHHFVSQICYWMFTLRT